MIVSFWLCYAAFSALCLSMDGHHREVFGRVPTRSRGQGLRLAGWLLLATSFAAALHDAGAPQGSVYWVGLLTASAGALVLLLTYAPRRVGLGAVLALAGAGIATLL
ncbi:DUF3325 domain-containing protein [Chitiniphilus purpureus]|uniref:DUF3325 domain-containing protein n=1 Tax=Chitiniphilus purpureus TaxID=2981137 RepID=A0ABY6DIY9_9NEIS|nr:DUF3325 domain-containing protein [Chitiniphilus sp. CD1]UXY13658.1 DUF3325 domain-containing protein [Chitiniphilus sp. CD1]